MSTFRNGVLALLNKEVYFLLSEKATKATILKINDDLVILKLSDNTFGYSEIAIHIDNLVLVTAP